MIIVSDVCYRPTSPRSPAGATEQLRERVKELAGLLPGPPGPGQRTRRADADAGVIAAELGELAPVLIVGARNAVLVARLRAHVRTVDSEIVDAQGKKRGIFGNRRARGNIASMATARNDRLRAAREASPSPRTPGAGLSRDELAETINTWLAEHTGRSGALDGQAVGRWERGAVRRPNRDYRTALRSLLDATDQELGFDNRAPAPAAAPAEFDPEGVLDTEDDERVAAVSRCPRRIDGSTLEAIAAVLASVRRLEDETSAAEVAPHVRAHAALTERLAHQGPDALRPHAVGLASEIAQYRGWLAVPDRHWNASQRHLDRAITLAHEAGDPQRLTTALSFSAYRAMRCDQLRPADSLSRAAREQTGIDAGLRTYLAFQRAEILARCGEGQHAARVLHEGDALIEHLPAADQLPDSGYWYTPAFFLGQRAFTQAALGDHHDAQESAAACLAEMPAEWSTSEWATRHRALAETP